MPKYKTIKSYDTVYKFTAFLCAVAPISMILALNLLSMILFKVFDIFWIGPALSFAAVFYWAVYAPSRFKLLSAFVAGFCSDILFLTPLCTQALVFFVTFKAVTKMRKLILPKSFKFVWAFFLLLSLIAFVAIWLIMSLVSRQFCALSPLMISAFVSWICYPFIVPCCNSLLKVLQRVSPYE